MMLSRASPLRFSMCRSKCADSVSHTSFVTLLAEQGDVDRIFGALRSARNEPLPKGLSDATLDLIVQALSRSDSGLAAASVADAAGVSRVTARRYLDHLSQLGKVELTMRYGGPGRPEHRYRLMAGAEGPQPVRPPGRG